MYDHEIIWCDMLMIRAKIDRHFGRVWVWEAQMSVSFEIWKYNICSDPGI